MPAGTDFKPAKTAASTKSMACCPEVIAGFKRLAKPNLFTKWWALAGMAAQADWIDEKKAWSEDHALRETTETSLLRHGVNGLENAASNLVGIAL